MTFATLCSGIGAPECAVRLMGLPWRQLWCAEINKFCNVVLQHHFPEVPNLGDITKIDGQDAIARYGYPDVLVAGTPCQPFSVAGKRLGIADPRGNVTLEFLRLVSEIRPRWVVWENVPGIFSSDGGRTFGQILGTLDAFGYGLAWRVLDAQFFGVPQRRRRVFLVGSLGSTDAVNILFDREGLRWHSTQSRKAWETNPGPHTRSTQASTARGVVIDRGKIAHIETAPTLDARYAHGVSRNQIVGIVASTVTSKWSKGTGGPSGDECQNLVVSRNDFRLRKYTPRECERLQGFPDDYTAVDGARDNARYRALGNAMAVPVIGWILRRIHERS